MKIKPNQRVYVLIRDVSRNGMNRTMSFFVVSKGRLQDVTGEIQRVTGFPYSKRMQGIEVGGAGQNMIWYAMKTYAEKAHGDYMACIYEQI